MIDQGTLLRYYKRKYIQEAIVRNAKDREIAIKYGDKGFGKRPDMLMYAGDVFEAAKQGATSFHASEELWFDPMKLGAGLKPKDLEDNRKGWDLVLDIDCNVLDYSKIAADILIKALKYQGVKNISCKFSGRAGFHIGVKHTCFPEKVGDKETRLLFPDSARVIALYLKEMIKEHLTDLILSFDSFDEIGRKTGKSVDELNTDGKFDVFKILDIDTILISPRHLYRMPYSFNEKSGWISVPINPDDVLHFDVSDAYPDNVKVNEFNFLEKGEPGEAKQLLIQAFDFAMKKKEIENHKEEYSFTTKKEFEQITEAVPEQCFPPCMKKILEGLNDGKKRSMFILVNFLSSCAWTPEMIEARLIEWNKKNKEPLRDTLLVGQVRYHKQRKQKILPPNCDNDMYYKGFHVCTPDNLCARIKNPVNYAVIKSRVVNQVNKEKEKELKKKNKDKIKDKS